MAIFTPGVTQDDYRWQFSAYFSNATNDLIIGHSGTEEMFFGIRFPGITIPKDATIISAVITLKCYDAFTGALDAYWQINEVDDATAPTNYAGASGLTLSEDLIVWTIPDGVANQDYDTPDLKSLIQLIVNRAGWASGQDMQLVCKCDPSTAKRSFYALDAGGGAYPASLNIEYFAGAVYDFAGNPVTATIKISGDLSAGAVLKQELPLLEATGAMTNKTAALVQELPMMAISASAVSGSVASLDTALPKLSAIGYGGGTGRNTLPLLVLAGTVKSGAVAALARDLPVLQISATALSGQSSSLIQNLPKLELNAHAFVEGLGSLNGGLPFFTIQASGLTGALVSIAATLPMLTFSGGYQVQGLLSLNGTLPMFYIHAEGRLIPAAIVYQVLAFNPKIAAVSEYDGFDFNSFALFNGKLLGAGVAGIHILEGEKDNGENIDVEIRLGQIPVTAKPREVFLMGRAGGPMIVTMSEDEDDEVTRPVEYLVRTLGQDRAKVPRGMKPTYFQVGVKNLEGADFDLDSIQIFAEAISSRRKG